MSPYKLIWSYTIASVRDSSTALTARRRRHDQRSSNASGIDGTDQQKVRDYAVNQRDWRHRPRFRRWEQCTRDYDDLAPTGDQRATLASIDSKTEVPPAGSQTSEASPTYGSVVGDSAGHNLWPSVWTRRITFDIASNKSPHMSPIRPNTIWARVRRCRSRCNRPVQDGAAGHLPITRVFGDAGAP